MGKADEVPTDKILVALARLQIFMVKLGTSFPPLIKDGKARARVPMTMLLSIMEDQLAELVQEIPWTVKSKRVLPNLCSIDHALIPA